MYVISGFGIEFRIRSRNICQLPRILWEGEIHQKYVAMENSFFLTCVCPVTCDVFSLNGNLYFKNHEPSLAFDHKWP